MLQRRYQWWGPNGLEWTDWYKVDPNHKKFQWEEKGKRRAEYREI